MSVKCYLREECLNVRNKLFSVRRNKIEKSLGFDSHFIYSSLSSSMPMLAYRSFLFAFSFINHQKSFDTLTSMR
jgi:hypothetical protein